MKVIFILGSGHCGSTLLDLILGAHPDIFGAGELEHLFSAGSECACRKETRDCVFWSLLAKKIKLNDLRIGRKKLDFLFGRNNYYFRAGKRKGEIIDAQKFMAENENLYAEISRAGEARAAVDSSKDVNRAEILSSSAKIEPIIIHLVRDGRAVVWSHFKKYNRVLPYMLKWFSSNMKIEILKRRSGTKAIFVHYEDLAGRPEETMKRVCSAAGINYAPDMLNYTQGARHQIGGNRMKFNQEAKIKVDNEWKEKMPYSHRFIFNLFFGWLNFYYAKKRF